MVSSYQNNSHRKEGIDRRGEVEGKLEIGDLLISRKSFGDRSNMLDKQTEQKLNKLDLLRIACHYLDSPKEEDMESISQNYTRSN